MGKVRIIGIHKTLQMVVNDRDSKDCAWSGFRQQLAARLQRA
eukprot:gene4266-3894_t